MHIPPLACIHKPVNFARPVSHHLQSPLGLSPILKMFHWKITNTDDTHRGLVNAMLSQVKEKPEKSRAGGSSLPWMEAELPDEIHPARELHVKPATS